MSHYDKADIYFRFYPLNLPNLLCSDIIFMSSLSCLCFKIVYDEINIPDILVIFLPVYVINDASWRCRPTISTYFTYAVPLLQSCLNYALAPPLPLYVTMQG